MTRKEQVNKELSDAAMDLAKQPLIAMDNPVATQLKLSNMAFFEMAVLLAELTDEVAELRKELQKYGRA